MPLGYFGQITDQTGGAPCGGQVPQCQIQTVPQQQQQQQQLPSSESVNAVLRGEQGGWGKVVISTALRAILILPGMALSGVRGSRLLWGAGLSSATITVFLFIFYGAKCDGRRQ